MLIKIIIGIIALAVIVFVIIENRLYDITRIKLKVKELPKGFDGVKIVHLSDLHLKSGDGYDYKIISMIRDLEPDYIFLTGDLISRNQTDLKKQKEFLKCLSEIAPIYFVFGNHENDADEEVQKELLSFPFEVLNNKSAVLERDGEYICICGVNIEPKYYLGENLDYKNIPYFDTTDLIEHVGDKKEDFTILLSHNPKFLKAYSEWGADLVFSGHVHGGAVRLFGKGILSPERRFFPPYTDGVYQSGETQMVVSRGLGKFRLFNHKEVILCILEGNQG